MGFRSAGSGRSPLSPLTVFESGYAASFYSFPSGHATVAVGFYGTLALLLAWRLSGGWRCAVAATGAFLVLFIGFSRLYLGYTTRPTSPWATPPRPSR